MLRLFGISLAMSLILMSASQLITVNHIIDPQSWVFWRMVLFSLTPEQSSAVRGLLVTVVWAGVDLVLSYLVSFKFSCSIFAQTQEL